MSQQQPPPPPPPFTDQQHTNTSCLSNDTDLYSHHQRLLSIVATNEQQLADIWQSLGKLQREMNSDCIAASPTVTPDPQLDSATSEFKNLILKD